MLNKKKEKKQHDFTDCGAACLSSVAAYYGLKISIAKLRFLAGTDQKGTSLAGMVEAAIKMGFTAKAIRTVPEHIEKIPTPFIAHIITKNSIAHFVVIYKVKKKQLKIMDPSVGEVEKISKSSFLSQWTKILILLAPSVTFNKENSEKNIWKRFAALIKPHKSIVLQILTAALFYSILGLSTSVYVEKLIDHIIPSGNNNLLNITILALIILLGFRVYTGWIKSMLILEIGVKIDSSLITAYYRHMLSLPQRFFDTMRIGEIISRVNDAVKIRLFISGVATDLFIDLMIVFFTLILMLYYSWKLSLIVILSFPLFLVLYFIYNRLNKKLLRKTMEHSASLESKMVESLSSINTVKRFNMKHIIGNQLEEKFINLLESVYKANRNSVFTLSLNDFITNIGFVFILWIGTSMVFTFEMSPGKLMSFYALFIYLTSPLNNLISSNRIIQDALIAADRLFQIMDLNQEKALAYTIEIVKENFSGISFENVAFRYGNGNYILTEMSFKAHSGHITGIAGESGCGKSTIFSLIQGIYTPLSGKITFNNYEMKYINKTFLNNFISIVPQKTDVFSASFIDNICLFQPSPNIDKALNVIEKLGMKEWIESLPQGLFTLIGENGINLSGGEKQKLSFARALYRDPEILLLDEATASLDKKSENYMHKIVIELKKKGKTILIASHKLSTLINCDFIYFIGAGKIIESGTHDNLMVSRGEYFKFWEKETLINN